MSKFWMVYVEDRDSPRKKHESLTLAQQEATRLALETGQPTYVLEAILVGRRTGVDWRSLEYS